MQRSFTKIQARAIFTHETFHIFNFDISLVADSDSGGEGDLMNYKGIYFNDDPNSKFTDPETGAHFQFRDMC